MPAEAYRVSLYHVTCRDCGTANDPMVISTEPVGPEMARLIRDEHNRAFHSSTAS